MAPRKTAKAPAETSPETPDESAAAPVCNVPDCGRTPTFRGLCDAHWASRRGDANKENTDG